MRFSGKTAFTLVLLSVTALMVCLSFQYKKGAGVVAMVIGIPTLILFAVQFVKEIILNKSVKYSEIKTIEKNESPQKPNIEEWKALVILAVFFAMIYVFGFFIAVPLFLFLFLKVRYSEGWILSMTLTGSASILLYLLFVKMIKLHIYKGIFFNI